MKALQEMEYLGEGGGCSCNRTKEMTGVLFFPLSQPLTIVMHICCHLLGPDTLLNQQIPGQSFGRNIDKMES